MYYYLNILTNQKYDSNALPAAGDEPAEQYKVV